MDAQIGRLFESVTNFFTGGDQLPWCDTDIISGCEKEVEEAEKGTDDDVKSESIMRLSWALVHSKKPEDVQRGLAMLEASLADKRNPLKLREKLYLLAVGYYRVSEYSRSREIVDQCLEVEPEWRQAQTLKKLIQDRIKRDGVIGIGIATSAAGLLVGGIAAALSRRN